MSKDDMKIRVVGGQIIQSALNTKIDEKTFDIGKAHCWLDMIQRGQRPRKWLKANLKGTKINFDYIKTDEEVDESFDELEAYLKQVNRKYGTDIELKRNIE